MSSDTPPNFHWEDLDNELKKELDTFYQEVAEVVLKQQQNAKLTLKERAQLRYGLSVRLRKIANNILTD